MRSNHAASARENTTHRRLAAAAALVAALGSAACGGAGAGAAPDPSFGQGGQVTTQLGGSDDEARALTILPDGRAVQVGEARPDAGSLRGFAAVRYLAGGGLDPSFGGGGTVFTAFSDTFGSGANAVAPQPDGKLVLAGFARHPERAHDGFAVVRYLQDGRLDPTFAGSGGVITAVDPQSGAGHNDIGRAVAVDPQGRILVAGETGGAFKDLALVRYLADGSLDPAFGDGGGVVTDLGGDDRAQALALQPDGKILVAGSGGRTSNEDFVLVRYLPDGRLDPSFGQGGHVTTDFRGGADRGQGLALRPDGKIVVGGVLQLSGGCEPRATCERYGLALAQYSSAGQLDPGFGQGGKVALDLITSSGGYGLARLSDGHLALVGHVGNEDFAVALLREDGRPEASFGEDGVARVSFGPGTDRASAVGALPDGGFLVGGSATTPRGAAFALARFRSN